MSPNLGSLEILNFDNDFEGIRDKLIIEIFYSTGIRRIELVELKLNSVNLDNKTLKVLGKRNKEQVVVQKKEYSGTNAFFGQGCAWHYFLK